MFLDLMHISIDLVIITFLANDDAKRRKGFGREWESGSLRRFRQVMTLSGNVVLGTGVLQWLNGEMRL